MTKRWKVRSSDVGIAIGTNVNYIYGVAVPLRRLDGSIGRRIDERARAYVAAGLRAVLTAPVARGRKALS